MISFREQIILIIYFLMFGMFLSAMFDMLHYFLRKLKIKQVFSYFVEFIFWMAMVIIACLYMLKVSDGYLTVYTFCFFFLGVVIYTYLLRSDFKKNIDLVVLHIGKFINKYIKIIIIIIYPEEVFIVVRKLFKKAINLIIKVIKNMVKLFKKRKTGDDDERFKENNSNNIVGTVASDDKWV